MGDRTVKYLDEQGQPQVYFVKCADHGTVATGIVGIAEMARLRREHITLHETNNEPTQGKMSHGYMKNFENP